MKLLTVATSFYNVFPFPNKNLARMLGLNLQALSFLTHVRALKPFFSFARVKPARLYWDDLWKFAGLAFGLYLLVKISPTAQTLVTNLITLAFSKLTDFLNQIGSF